MTVKSIDIEELTNAVDRVSNQLKVMNDLIVLILNQLERRQYK